MSSSTLAVAAALGGGTLGALTAWPAYRLSVEYGEPPRSACGACAAGISSWVRVTRRCAACAAPVGVRPVWTALAGGFGAGLLVWALRPSFLLLAALVLSVAGVLLGAIDVRVLRLPDPIVLGCFAGAVLLLTAEAAWSGHWSAYARAWLGAAAAFAGYLVFALLPGAPMGFGDVKLAGVLGLVLGYLGWPTLILGLFLAFLVNGPASVVALVRRGRGALTPFGPAMLVGALLAIVLTAPR
ncbi:MAG: prepilin peptidase [Catenulispora sp.]|nr:prepilin peptidase [Catenulispora sp.]